MRRRLLAGLVLIGALLCLFPVRTAGAAGESEPETVIKCSECGMNTKVANRYTSRLVQGALAVYFCDIGDLTAFIERTHPKDSAASVHDFISGDWIDADKASFVIDKKIFSSPMGWGIAAFRDREAVAGATLDFEALRKALR